MFRFALNQVTALKRHGVEAVTKPPANIYSQCRPGSKSLEIWQSLIIYIYIDHIFSLPVGHRGAILFWKPKEPHSWPFRT